MSATEAGSANATPAEGTGADSMRLPDVYAKAVGLTEELQKISANTAEYKAKQAETLRLFSTAGEMIDQLRLFSEDEHFSEHSTDSLEYLLVFALKGDLLGRKYPAVDESDRDAKRIVILASAKALFEEYLERCGDLGLGDGKPADLAPGARPDRDAKMAQLREQMDLEKKLKVLAQQLADSKTSKKPIDEDLERAHMLTTLQTWIAKAKGQLGTLSQELSMLEQMAAHRLANPVAGDAGADVGGAIDRRQRAPAEPPTVITKEMISEMIRTGQPINRADFKLITKGFGPIGAPTMSLDEFADKEIAEAMQRSQAAAEAEAAREKIDPDSEEAQDAETYKLRRQDVEYKDHVRRGDGNRHNQG